MGSGLSREHKKAVSAVYFRSAKPLYSGVSNCSESAPESGFLCDKARVRRDTIK
jgi:hypothetical protein